MAMQRNDGNGAAKNLAEKKAKKMSRTDVAGRSGFGESAGSNLMYKGPYKPTSMVTRKPSAILTAAAGKPMSYGQAASMPSYAGALDYANRRRKANQTPGRIGGY